VGQLQVCEVAVESVVGSPNTASGLESTLLLLEHVFLSIQRVQWLFVLC
jgi:hypothetical protein